MFMCVCYRRQLPISHFFSSQTGKGSAQRVNKKSSSSQKTHRTIEESPKKMGVFSSKQEQSLSQQSFSQRSSSHPATPKYSQQSSTPMDIDKSDSPTLPSPASSSPQPLKQDECSAENLNVQGSLESLDGSLDSPISQRNCLPTLPKSRSFSFSSQPNRHAPQTTRVQCSPPNTKSMSHSSPSHSPKDQSGDASSMLDNDALLRQTENCSPEKSDPPCNVPISNKNIGSDGNNSTPPRPCGTDSDAAGKQSSDSDSDLSDYDNGHPTLALLRTTATRRSARIAKATNRYQPSSYFRKSHDTSSVFGYRFSVNQDLGKHSGVSNVQRFLREYEQIEAQEKEVEKMREDMENSSSILDEGEIQFKNLADDQDEISVKERISRDKYSDPLPIFKDAIDIQSIPSQLKSVSRASNPPQPFTKNESEILSSCPLHDLLVEVESCGHSFDLCSNVVGPFFKMFSEISTIRMEPMTIQRMFRVCIFDDSDVRVEHSGREELFDALLEFIHQRKYESPCPNLPSLSDTLKCYGAVMLNDGLEHRETKGDGDTMCLDKIVREAPKSRSEQNQKTLDMAMRNVRRSLRFAAVQIDSNWPISLVVGLDDSAVNDEVEAVIQTVTFCTKLLLSCFGSRLKRDVGLVIKAALSRIDPNRWPNVRWKIAQSVMSLTSRLSLHVELVTYLYPMSCTRSLYCSLDIAYMSLYQWCEGPGDDPKPRSLTDLHPSDAAHEAGLDVVSFCVGDVLNLTKHIPEMNRVTDVVWICGLSRLLKQILTMPEVIKLRKRGEIGSLSHIIQKMRQCSHRVAFGVAVQDMRIALDTMIRTIRSMCPDKDSRAELDPNVKEDLVQTTLK